MKDIHTLVVGDTHGNWDYLLRILYEARPTLCLIAGDFGWWPSIWLYKASQGIPMSIEYLEACLPAETEVRFIEGNHEEFSVFLPYIQRLQQEQGLAAFEPVSITRRISYLPRGCTLDLVDGRRVFCCGGAKSVDWKLREKGKSWFPEEILKRSDLPKELTKADIVLSHTTPRVFGIEQTLPRVAKDSLWDVSQDPSCTVLDEVYQKVQPQLWLASHFHVFRKGRVGLTDYVVLNRTDTPHAPFNEQAYILVKK